MKKILLIAGVLSCSVVGFSQKAATQPADTQQKTVVAASPQERINRLETEVADLKATQTEMKKQLSELQAALPDKAKRKKPVVNRVGSKQVTWSSGDE